MKIQYFKKIKKGDSLKSFLLVLLLSVAGLLNAQDFTVDNLNYSVNPDGVSVTLNGSDLIMGTLTIPETVNYNGNDYSVTIIKEQAFFNHDWLTGSLTIPNSVTKIGWGAFNGCTGFTGDLTLPNSLEEIPSCAFQDCSGLTSLMLPNSLKRIGYSAFDGCAGIISFTIPNSVSSIEEWAFMGTGWWDALPDGIVYKDNCCIYFKGSIPTGTLEIAEGTRLIAGSAFLYCDELTSLSLPSSLEIINEKAFQNCTGLTSLTLPNSLKSIGEDAFWGCTGITSFNIPNSVINIEERAFYETGWWNTQPNGVVYKDDCCLGYKSEKPTGALEVAEGTRLIAASAFYECVGLTSLTLPNSLEEINNYAFLGCYGLTSIEILALTPPTLSGSVFGSYNTVTVTVPQGTLSAYQAAPGWSEFTHLMETPSAAIDEIYVEGFTAPAWGMHPDFNLTVPVGAHYAVDEVAWFYDNDEMAHGDVFNDEDASYYMMVVLTPESGYSFAPDAKVLFNGDASINDATYNTVLSDGSFSAYTIDFHVTMPTSNIVSEIRVEGFTAPAWGAQPDFDVTVPADAHYAVDEVLWFYNNNEMSPSATFNDAGGTYYMLVYIMPESGYAFDPEATVLFNGDASINDVPYNAILSDGTFAAYTIDYHVTSPAPSTYNITASANPSVGGTASGGGTYNSGATCTLRATANGGYQFLNWTKNGAEMSTNATYIFTVTENAQYVANFIQSQTLTYMLTVSCNPSMGAVTGNGTYAAGTQVTVEAIPYKGYVFDRWNDGVTANPRNVTINGNMTLVAFFNGTGVDENGTALLNVYPNPASETLRINGLETNATVEIYNSLGMMVKTVNVDADEEINISDLAPGTYMIRCGKQTIRFVKTL